MREYVSYLKDNPKKYWFKRKLYGWGWTPARWQGWAFLALWIALFVEFFIVVNKNAPTPTEMLLAMIVPTLLLFALLFLICYGTGEKPKWGWGNIKP